MRTTVNAQRMLRSGHVVNSRSNTDSIGESNSDSRSHAKIFAQSTRPAVGGSDPLSWPALGGNILSLSISTVSQKTNTVVLAMYSHSNVKHSTNNHVPLTVCIISCVFQRISPHVPTRYRSNNSKHAQRRTDMCHEQRKRAHTTPSSIIDIVAHKRTPNVVNMGELG